MNSNLAHLDPNEDPATVAKIAQEIKDDIFMNKVLHNLLFGNDSDSDSDTDSDDSYPGYEKEKKKELDRMFEREVTKLARAELVKLNLWSREYFDGLQERMQLPTQTPAQDTTSDTETDSNTQPSSSSNTQAPNQSGQA